jgi:hypothetical protein
MGAELIGETFVKPPDTNNLVEMWTPATRAS